MRRVLGLFELLRVHAGARPGFRAEEDAPGKNNVIVLSHGMWQRRFGGDPASSAARSTLNGAPVTIIGVMPPGFSFPSRRRVSGGRSRSTRPRRPAAAIFSASIARLKPGVTVAQAGAEMKTISERLAEQYPDTSADESAEVVPVCTSRSSAGTAGAADAARRGRRRRADRLRQRRQPAAGARLGAREGDRDPDGARRRPAPAGDADARREPGARARRRRARRAARLPGHPSDSDAQRRQHSAGCRTSRSTAPCCSSRVAMSLRDRAHLRPRAGVAGVAAAAIRRSLKEGGRSSTTGGGRWMRNALLVARSRCRSCCWSAPRCCCAASPADERRSRLPRRERPRVPRRAAAGGLSRGSPARRVLRQAARPARAASGRHARPA